MIARDRRQWQSCAPSAPSWQAELRAAVRDLATLCHRLDIDPAWVRAGQAAARSYSLCVPQAWLGLIEPGNPQDPLLRQVLPSAGELREQPGFGPDPVGDRAAEQTPGLLCKYAGRALLLTTGACAIHCRYCFRRWFPFAAGLNHREPARRVLAALARRPDIQEVILSGGDPLLLNDHSLGTLLAALDGIAHLQRVRIHTRIPLTLPGRLTPGLCHLLSHGRLQRVLVVQTNHPAELGEAARAALARLRAHGLLLLNQSVLLRGVNDCAETLIDLSERLFACGVLPYYLHRLDPVAGAADFALPMADCLTLSATLRAALPGYLLPRLVAEHPGALSKTPLGIAESGAL
jgi:EF-P beta-lysylation protein EpmB